jgi:hypothetical protein
MIGYVVAAVVIILSCIVAILVLELLRPEKDNSTLYALIIGFTGPTLASIMAFMKAQETHLSVNSRLDAFIRNAREAAHAEGITEGQGMQMVSRTQGPVTSDPTKPPVPPDIGFKITSIFMKR